MIEARNATPADALMTSGSTSGEPARGSTTPARPAAVAVRMIIPTFAGLFTPSRTSTRDFASGLACREAVNSARVRIFGATTSARTP
jgi:hypothetical protein